MAFLNPLLPHDHLNFFAFYCPNPCYIWFCQVDTMAFQKSSELQLIVSSIGSPVQVGNQSDIRDLEVSI